MFDIHGFCLVHTSLKDCCAGYLWVESGLSLGSWWYFVEAVRAEEYELGLVKTGSGRERWAGLGRSWGYIGTT